MPKAAAVTIARLRERLAGTRLPEDPADVVLPSNIDEWPEDLAAHFTTGLKPAGVLIPIIEHLPHPSVLLTRRSAGLKNHASQISFPGGRMEEHDADIEATALRETEEEIGIPPASVTVLGYLEPMPTVTGYAVTPIVGVVPPRLQLSLDRSEVEVAFEAPLAFLLDEGNARRTVRRFRGHDVPIVEFHFGGHRIWGATANMLIRLREKVI